MTDQNTLYWIWLAEKCGVASKQFDRLMEKYESPFDIYRLEEAEIEQFDELNDALKAKLCQKDLDAAYEILKYCRQNNVDVITFSDRRYPERLKNIQDPPVLLYCKGHFPDFNSSLCIGVVGTRKMSEYGKRSAYKIAYELGKAGAVTVSGMALGIDGVAACGTLFAKGITVAVLGCGVDTAYPKHHKRLMEEIARHGAVITEYPPKEEPRAYNFPKRNRIISGLCQGVLVVEAASGSGALITAKDALAQGRDVFALPGEVGAPNSEGPNQLIKDGSYTALCASDILKKYEFLYGDVADVKRIPERDKRADDADSALKKYGLDYAVGTRSDGTEEAFAKTPVMLKENRKKVKPKREEREEEKQETKRAETQSENASAVGDSSTVLTEELDPVTKRIFENIPQDRAISIDGLMLDGLSVTDVITSLTMLEIYGLVTTLPGGLYIRK